MSASEYGSDRSENDMLPFRLVFRLTLYVCILTYAANSVALISSSDSACIETGRW